MSGNKIIQLAHLVDMRSPYAVFEEVKYNFIQLYPINEFEIVRKAFDDFNDLFEGKYTGYRACNTKFHDKIHTSDALLAISRIIDGYNLQNSVRIPVSKVKIALIATIFHDAGYIQNIRDKKGTGAKYTLNHVERSIDFISKYFKEKGFSNKDYKLAKIMIASTGITSNNNNKDFAEKYEKILGNMLATSDFLGQMASRTYLERLVYLYREFKEGHVKGYDSEQSLLEKTLVFYDEIKHRIENDFCGVYKYARVHFKTRYRINHDLYIMAIEGQIKYLGKILNSKEKSCKNQFRRTI